MRFDRLYHGKKTLRTTIIALLLVSAFMLPAVAEINKVGTYFWINPERNIYGDVTDTFDIAINIANAPATYAWELTLSWNTSVLNATSATQGTWLSSAGSTSFFDTINNVAGQANIGETLVGPSAGASGSGWLCNVSFLVIGSGRSALSLDDTFLVDLNIVSTNYPNNDGYFCTNDAFSCLHDVYIVEIRVSATEVQQDTIVNITVEIHNEGNHSQIVDVIVSAEPGDARYIAVPIYTFQDVPIAVCQHINLSVLWDTTPVAGESWTIVGEIIKDDGSIDNDPHDNIYIGPVVKVTSTHDIKVVDVTPLKSKVHKGDIAQVNVTVHNEGKVPENVTVKLLVENTTDLLFFTGPGVLTVCEYYTWMPPFGPVPEPCTWWHIIDAPDAPWLVDKEFHIDELIGDLFHMDFIWPDYPEPLAGIVVAEREIVVDETIVELDPCVPVTITFDWNTSLFEPKDYVVAALAMPVVGELMKNWPDNKIKDPENTITVTYTNIAMANVRMLDASTCYSGGFNPVAVPEITLINTGLEPVKVLVYYIADPNMSQPGDESIFGVSVIGPLNPGAGLQTFRGCAPFGGWDMNNPIIAPPVNFPVPGTTYTIIASLSAAPGYKDDNPLDNANIAVWTLPVVSHDVIISDISLPHNFVYRGNPLTIEVTVTNQVNVTETFDLTLKNGTTVIGTATGVSIGGLATQTLTITLATGALKTCKWYTLNLEGNVTIAVDDDPCDNIQTKYATFYVRVMGDVAPPYCPASAVNILDVATVASVMASLIKDYAYDLAPSPGYAVNILDVATCASAMSSGYTCGNPPP